MLQQGCLDIRRDDGDATPSYDLLGTADEQHEPARIQHGAITGAEPAAGEERGVGQSRVAEIGLQPVRPAQEQITNDTSRYQVTVGVAN